MPNRCFSVPCWFGWGLLFVLLFRVVFFFLPIKTRLFSSKGAVCFVGEALKGLSWAELVAAGTGSAGMD